MPLKIKNAVHGFVDATGFHPFRYDPEYDADRAGDDYDSRGREKTARKYARKVGGRAGGKRGSKRKPAKRRNPVPTRFVPAQVRRIGKDIQILLLGGKLKAKRKGKRRR